MKDKKVILIHGHTSSPQRKKYRIIAKALEEQGIDYSIPTFPEEELTHSKQWLEIIDREVRNSKKPIILVGHSLGTRAILLYLDQFSEKIDAVLLVSAFNNDFQKNRKRSNGDYADFFDHALDIKKIKKLADKFIVVHSKDDDTIDYEQGVEISKELGAELKTYDKMKHFSGKEKAEESAEIFLEYIQSVL